MLVVVAGVLGVLVPVVQIVEVIIVLDGLMAAVRSVGVFVLLVLAMIDRGSHLRAPSASTATSIVINVRCQLVRVLRSRVAAGNSSSDRPRAVVAGQTSTDGACGRPGSRVSPSGLAEQPPHHLAVLACPASVRAACHLHRRSPIPAALRLHPAAATTRRDRSLTSPRSFERLVARTSAAKKPTPPSEVRSRHATPGFQPAISDSPPTPRAFDPAAFAASTWPPRPVMQRLRRSDVKASPHRTPPQPTQTCARTEPPQPVAQHFPAAPADDGPTAVP